MKGVIGGATLGLMKTLTFLSALVAMCTSAVSAADLPTVDLARLKAADIVVLGETHDNPGHHDRQARLVAALHPKALVFEMLTPQQAARVGGELPGDAVALDELLGWDASGWPDFTMYYPIFVAGSGARVFGAAVPRLAARRALEQGVAEAFGADAAIYGLTTPLPPAQQKDREELQRIAHCDALPGAMLPGMVAVQRLRDAELARAAIEALDATGGPVAVITGNGHARRDGAVPAIIGLVRPDLAVFALGQSEAGEIEGEFDAIADSPKVDRPDPCEAFRDRE